jgi:hypothetical protein
MNYYLHVFYDVEKDQMFVVEHPSLIAYIDYYEANVQVETELIY